MGSLQIPESKDWFVLVEERGFESPTSGPELSHTQLLPAFML